MKEAIVLSGHTMALGVARSLGEMGVDVVMVRYNKKDMGHTSKYIVESILAPNPDSHEKEFIELIHSLASKYPGAVIFPVSDETVLAISKHKKALEKNFLIACPEWHIAQTYIDKKLTSELAKSSGVAAPNTIIPEHKDDVINYAKKATFPCLIKPIYSHKFQEKFKCKMFPVNNEDELLESYTKAKSAGLGIMIQEVIPGNDNAVVNYNAYFINGNPIVEFTSEHIRNAPPLWGSPRVARSKYIPEVIEPGRKILKAMNFDGYACTEFKRDDRDGSYKLMEVNCRHNLSTLLAVRCGVNFPWIQYAHLTNNELPYINKYKTGVYWIDITRDVGYSLRYLQQERYSISQYISPYLNSPVFAIFDSSDIRPFIQRCIYLFREAINFINPLRKESS